MHDYTQAVKVWLEIVLAVLASSRASVGGTVTITVVAMLRQCAKNLVHKLLNFS